MVAQHWNARALAMNELHVMTRGARRRPWPGPRPRGGRKGCAWAARSA